MSWQAPTSLPACRFLPRPTRAIAGSLTRAVKQSRFGGVVLTVGATDARWWQVLAGSATALCLVSGRRLVRETGEIDLLGPRLTRQGQAVGAIALYFGASVSTFTTTWSTVGSVVFPYPGHSVRTPRTTCPGPAGRGRRRTLPHSRVSVCPPCEFPKKTAGNSVRPFEALSAPWGRR